MKLLITYGTRPEWIKVKPLITELKNRGIEHYTLFTGQHANIAPAKADFVFKMNSYVSNNRLDDILGNILIENCELYSSLNNDKNDFTHVLVQGDTTSAMGIALSAFHNGKQVIHLEAGLRTYDKENPYPEEVNRRIISEIADIHLCPTTDSMINLRSENIKKNIYVVGNTALDNLLEYKEQCEYGNTILVTLHRRENHVIMDQWFGEINKLAVKYPNLKFILPIHPNPNVQKHRKILTNVSVVEPLEHKELLELLIKTKMVITDSGGLQEECSFLNKKCLVCRKETERPESLGLSSYLILEPNQLVNVFEEHIDNYIINHKSPYGDGQSAKKIVDFLFENQ